MMIELVANYLSAVMILFLVIDPLGNIPVFLSILKDIEPKRRWKIILRELLIAVVILLIFLFYGQNLLDLLHLQSESVSIAGGIILFIIGIRMVFPTRRGIMGDQLEGEPLNSTFSYSISRRTIYFSDFNAFSSFRSKQYGWMVNSFINCLVINCNNFINGAYLLQNIKKTWFSRN